MKVAMILSAPLPPREGIGFYAWNLARQLTHRGHTIHLITRGKAAPLNNRIVDGITIWEVPFVPLYPLHVQIHNLFVRKLIKDLKSELDLLHLHSPLVMAPITDLPILVTVHTPMKSDVCSIRSRNLYALLIKLQLPFSVLIEKELFERAEKLVTVASSVTDELRAYNIIPGNVLVFGNGVDVDLFTPLSAHPDLQKGYFISAGRLGPRKGWEDLIEAARIVHAGYPGISFHILGDGPLYPVLKRKIRQAGLENSVILAGHITDRFQMAEYYQSAIGFIHPAHYEGLPTVLLEAMACGKAVVSTAVSGALDVVEDNINGLLVEPRSPQSLAQAIESLLQNPKMISRLGRAARETVSERCTWEIVTDRYEAVYQDILLGRKHS